MLEYLSAVTSWPHAAIELGGQQWPRTETVGNEWQVIGHKRATGSGLSGLSCGLSLVNAVRIAMDNVGYRTFTSSRNEKARL